MKLNSLTVLSLVGMMAFSTSCKYTQSEMDRAVLDNYNAGYDDGFIDGDAAGYERARVYFASADYNSGFADGEAVGYTNGFNVGSASGYTNGYNNGYSDGYVDGDFVGYTDGYNDGYTDGDFDGYNFGYNDGYTDGYDDGFYDGYDIGFDDGWDAAFGFSVETLATNTNNPKVNLLSKVSNSLVDVSKIKAPVFTSRGIEANGSLIFEETSMISRDLEKRAAAVESYLVKEMGKQIVANFGLSEERAIKVAKISNHWRKFSTTRAVTADDADAFSEELTGSNLKAIEVAVKDSLRGNTSDLNSLIERAAVQNQTSPEQISQMMNSLFF